MYKKKSKLYSNSGNTKVIPLIFFGLFIYSFIGRSVFYRLYGSNIGNVIIYLIIVLYIFKRVRRTGIKNSADIAGRKEQMQPEINNANERDIFSEEQMHYIMQFEELYKAGLMEKKEYEDKIVKICAENTLREK